MTMNNREIKFRVFNIDSKKWVKNLTYCIDDFSTTNKDWHKIMQYTGLKDKNGKEIYEGDILFDHLINAKCEVVFGNFPTLKDDYGCEERSFKFCVLWSDKSGYSSLDDERLIEVIGNIHDTPELLTPPKNE